MTTAAEYLRKPYHIWMVYDDSGDGTPAWVVGVEELKGCLSQGDSAAEAAEMIQEAMRAWIEVALEDSVPIPEPRTVTEHSGRFMLRLPAGLHATLESQARTERVSLNSYISALLAGAAGWSPRAMEPGDGPGRRPAAPSRRHRGSGVPEIAK